MVNSFGEATKLPMNFETLLFCLGDVSGCASNSLRVEGDESLTRIRRSAKAFAATSDQTPEP